MMKAKNLIKRVTIGILAVVLSTSVVWADDNPGLIQRAKDACKNATYDIPTVTNDIDGWPQGPAIMCDSAVVMEAESGEVLYNKAMDERRYPASTTKIMTALVALEHSNLTDTVTFTAEGLKEAVPGNSYVTRSFRKVRHSPWNNVCMRLCLSQEMKFRHRWQCRLAEA